MRYPIGSFIMAFFIDGFKIGEIHACNLLKMQKSVERIEFKTSEEKKAWMNDIEKAAKVFPRLFNYTITNIHRQNCFELWKKDFFKPLLDQRNSRRSVTSFGTSPRSGTPPILSTPHVGGHNRSSSLGDMRSLNVSIKDYFSTLFDYGDPER